VCEEHTNNARVNEDRRNKLSTIWFVSKAGIIGSDIIRRLILLQI